VDRTITEIPSSLAHFRYERQANGALAYTKVHEESSWKHKKVGIREFRDKLASYLLESDVPMAITRHGDTVGYYISARRKRSDAERGALQEAAFRWHEVLAAEGISEDEALKDFREWRLKKQK
jgi:PHD/YefM family antitoxin component YafN of YafNO toxin-antitoxin module